jgi:hypothetical protein
MVHRILFVLVLISLLYSCSGIQRYGAPYGLFYTSRIMHKDMPDSGILGSKSGRACVTGWMGLVAMGDGSVKAAAASGGILHIRAVDVEHISVFVFYEKSCVIVHGD